MRVVKSIVQWLTREERLQKYPALRRFFWKRGEIYRRMEAIAARMREKEVITVAFMVMDLPCWKCDSVFRLMMQHPRFRPIIWLVPEIQLQDEEERRRKHADMQSFFAARQYPVAGLISLQEMRAQYAPDIVFLPKPYAGATAWEVKDMDRELVCYVPYCFQNGKDHDFLYGQENVVWYNFYPTPGVLRICERIMPNAAANVVVTGAPVADHYLFEKSDEDETGSAWKNCPGSPLRIIWAPHWTVASESVMGECWFKVSTFLDVAEGMLQLAEKYTDQVQWAFKPHPLLRDTLYQLPEWGKERTDAYYERWASMPNTQLETGAYVELFKQSDAMVHDSGSFIMEYLLVDKPCMYLQLEGASVDFNEDTQRALDCYRKGKSIEDVESFLLELLQGKPDAMSRPRARYRKNSLIPPCGKTAAQNIIDVILKGW